jgi:hypothetical protein
MSGVITLSPPMCLNGAYREHFNFTLSLTLSFQLNGQRAMLHVVMVFDQSQQICSVHLYLYVFCVEQKRHNVRLVCLVTLISIHFLI